MQFASKEDIEAPIEEVFDMLCEFESFERSAIRRGVEVRRVSDSVTPRAGLEWRAKFDLRGKPRELDLQLAEFDRPNAMKFDAKSGGLDSVMAIDLVSLSPRRTRISVAIDLKPRTLSARLLVQSLKLAKANLTKRFKLKVAEYAKSLEDRHKSSA